MGSFIIEFLFEIAVEAVFHWLPKRSREKILARHINRLRKEDWFCELERDYRYEYIICQNSRVRKFLSREKNIKLITNVDTEKDKFIKLIEEEHHKFTTGR
ncbi:hypothetical protein SAMN05443252_10939 [Bacillus sp. OV322]|uniref:hypothetical protein n=1 Tax=Bacillus sp. OV322 TaxID=1882764 RepID=UPI0008E7F224|nr:hypothetical protein [Bacillus sp. OV322]SFC94033.1 hypothetical protein SAMN05443252_10939 [Bacillus sp. OV322]